MSVIFGKMMTLMMMVMMVMMILVMVFPPHIEYIDDDDESVLFDQIQWCTYHYYMTIFRC